MKFNVFYRAPKTFLNRNKSNMPEAYTALELCLSQMLDGPVFSHACLLISRHVHRYLYRPSSGYQISVRLRTP